MKAIEPILKLVDYTYAETCNGEIRIHKELQYYSPELFKHAINHELGHQGLTVWEDLVWDLKDLGNFRIHAKAILFYLLYPKLILRMVSPIHFSLKKRQIEINYVLIFIYVTYILFTWYMFSLF